ncbi:tektin-B1-like [Myripristis murdjan]|uniref:tektin-B1-like n=1 Tax=Myripristis murdjan TaxID=586833 RepID=UPI001175E677|nr:tektin-B1-like [Myripristis murdjan]
MPHAAEKGQERPVTRCCLKLPQLTSNSSLVAQRSLSRGGSGFRLNQEICCAPNYAFPQIPRLSYGTMRQLSARREELSRWQTQASESISRVDQEVTTLQQVREVAEQCVQEKMSHCQVLLECVRLRSTTGDLSQDPVLLELQKEEQLAQQIRELVQSKISILLDKLSSLREIRTQLQQEYQDKGEAIKINTKCVTYDPSTLANHHYPDQTTTGTHSYDQWLSRCRSLKQTVDKLLQECCSFRGNLKYTLAKVKNTLESQRSATDRVLRRRINEIVRAKEVLEWERHQVNVTITDLVEEKRQVEAQLMNCESTMQLAQSRLDILTQRPGRELCLDQPQISLMSEADNLAKVASGLRMKLQLTQQTLQPEYRSLYILEDQLADKARALDVDLRCQSLCQRHLPVCGSTAVITNKTEPHPAPGHLQPWSSLH